LLINTLLSSFWSVTSAVADRPNQVACIHYMMRYSQLPSALPLFGPGLLMLPLVTTGLVLDMACRASMS
jgi:hypothetical protein